MLKLRLQYFGHLMRRTDSFEKTLMLAKIEARGEGDDRGWDGWMASPTQRTWVWASSGFWWWTGRPGVLQSIGWRRVGHDWVTVLNWIETLDNGGEVKWSEVAQSCPTLCDPWTVAHQSPPSMGFSRQEYWSGLPFPSPGDLPDPGIKPINPKENQSWIFIGRADAEAEDLILWSPDEKSWVIRKNPDARKDWRRRQEEKGTTEDEMAGWHHRLNGHEFEQALGDDEGRTGKPGILQSMGLQRLSDWTNICTWIFWEWNEIN